MRIVDLERIGAVDTGRLVEFHRDRFAVLREDEDRIRRGERRQRQDHRPQVVGHAVDLHDPIHRDRQKRRRNDVGHQRRVAQHPAVLDPHPADREAGQRADRQSQEHHRQPDVEAVAELMPEPREIPKVLGHHDAEAFQRRMVRPDRAAEHVVVAVERDHPHVVDRQQRPDGEHDAERDGQGFQRRSAATGRYSLVCSRIDGLAYRLTRAGGTRERRFPSWRSRS